ncbi:protocadherin-7-like [Octopus sinensis]|uniref:Protocadherin-7-like n=1 Tax=Octopus sinensis TaxID=2607531 RepID=A0A6P7U7W5_9MOLL|nr:protocadherin-7-like [Octopus sinensis]
MWYIFLLCPGFSTAVLVYSVREELPVGTVIGNVFEDLRLENSESSQLTYGIFENSAAGDLFEIDKTGNLITLERIDREGVCSGSADECFVFLRVLIGFSNGRTNIADLKVKITDINDNNPTFDPPSLTVDVLESSNIGELIPIKSAEDRDSKEYGITEYRILNKSEIPFSLKKRETHLYLELLQKLDRESHQSYFFEIVAQDSGGQVGVLNVTVNILDENDNVPTFVRQIFTFYVSENAPVGYVVGRVEATDPDEGINALIHYKVDSRANPKVAKFFQVDQNSGKVILSARLDYEKINYFEFPVVAYNPTKSGMQATAYISVFVVDFNDNKPQITLLGSSTLSVAENSPDGTVIGNLFVSDADSDSNGKFECTVNDNRFKLATSRSGGLLLIKRGTLDREESDKIEMLIICQDKGVPTLFSSEKLVIEILDSNDNPPVFEQASYTCYVIENAIIQNAILNVKATDIDAGVNGEIKYFLKNGTQFGFSIDPDSGDVYLGTSLDRESQSSYSLEVVAVDGGVPQLSASVILQVWVVDQNDSPPEFERREYYFRVLKNTPIGEKIGSIFALDPDLNSQTEYSIDSAYFQVDKNTGTIYLNRPLRKAFSHEATIIAKDVDKPNLMDTAKIVVNVFEENPPEILFPNSQQNHFPLNCRASVGTQIFRITIRDPILGPLTYEIDEPEYFSVNKTGSVRLAKSLDFVGAVEFSIKVTDSGIPPLFSITNATVQVMCETPFLSTNSLNLMAGILTIIVFGMVILVLVFLRKNAINKKPSEMTSFLATQTPQFPVTNLRHGCFSQKSNRATVFSGLLTKRNLSVGIICGTLGIVWAYNDVIQNYINSDYLNNTPLAKLPINKSIDKSGLLHEKTQEISREELNSVSLSISEAEDSVACLDDHNEAYKNILMDDPNIKDLKNKEHPEAPENKFLGALSDKKKAPKPMTQSTIQLECLIISLLTNKNPENGNFI